jgi:CO/xanthine dehydrogenase Mo-binding subunit
VASELPMIEPVMVEVPNPGHPYGAKGVAEVNICPPKAAIANAIERAVRTRLAELPNVSAESARAIDVGGKK